MAGAGNEILDPLDAAERGFVLGALLLHPSGDTDPAARLEVPSDARCGDALARIAALPRSERVKLTRQLAREVVAPLPAGLEEVDQAILANLLHDEPPDVLHLIARAAPPSVRQAIASRLAAEPPPTLGTDQVIDFPRPQNRGDRAPREANGTPAASVVGASRLSAPAEATRPEIAPGPPHEVIGRAGNPDGTSPELLIELQRVIFSRIVPVRPADQGAGPGASTARGLLLLDGARRTAELSRRGALVLALSLRGARREVILRAAALAGPPWADQILAVACAADVPAEDDHPPMDRAAALELVAATAPAAVPGETVTRLGARAAGARMTREGERGLGGADQARAVAQRLSPAIGAELLSGAGLGVEIG